MTELYKRVQELITRNNISISAVEKGADLKVDTLKNWSTSMPGGDKILRVANFFDVSVDYLLGNTDNPKSHKNIAN